MLATEAAVTAAEPTSGRTPRAVEIILGVGLHLLLVIAVVQAWMVSWPGKMWLMGGALLAIGLSITLWKGPRNATLLVGCVAIAALFVLPALRYGPSADGLRIGGLPFGVASGGLIVVALAISAWQLWTLASSPRVPRWLRFIPVVLALYAVALIVPGLVRGGSVADAMSADGRLPYWISGPYIGGAILLPLAVLAAIASLGIALARRQTSLAALGAISILLATGALLSGLELTRQGRPNLAQFLVPVR